MGFVELFLIGIGLSMDAFAVSICKGLSVQHLRVRHMLLAGLYFGAFQALMPLLGYLLGAGFAGTIEAYDHWIAFLLLGLIGANMIREALSGGEREKQNDDFSFRAMLPLAVATSIDALAVGVSFAFLQTPIFQAVAVIGLTTFCFGVAGVKIGRLFGAKYETKAELMGGIILILIGSKILLEHLGILG
ncbi:manganese efflux pump MntP family protein [bacterium 210917-DFI.7.65]|nr:manganese efflux pump MntP family protein [bacterium 210917-DFI.7.65]